MSWARRARHRIVYGVARAAAGMLATLPFDVAVGIGRMLGWLGYYVVYPERRRALDHLRVAFGDTLTDSQRRRIAHSMFTQFGNIAAEMTHIPRWTAEDLRRRVHVADEEKYLSILDEGRRRGFICITAHLGAWEYVAQYGALVSGYDVVAVAREQGNPFIQAWAERVRAAHGVEIVYRKRAGVPTFRALKQGRGVGILLDQCTKGDGVFTPFFGRPTHTLTGPARLALRTGAVVAPLFMIREDGGKRMTLHVHDPVPLPEEKNTDEAVYQLTATLASIIEDQIRRWPEQWVWIHRRWRRTPENDSDPVFDPVTGTVVPQPRKELLPREIGSSPHTTT